MYEENYLIKGDTLEDIADAIREKKQSQDTIAVSDFANEIENLPSGGSIISPTRLSFQNQTDITSFDFSNIDTSKITSATDMFYGCSNLSNIDLSNFNTSNVTAIDRLFAQCKSLTNIDMSNLDLSKVRTLTSLFEACNKLTLIIFGTHQLTNLNYFQYVFSGCSSLEEVDLSGLQITRLERFSWVFNGCSSLKHIDIRQLDFSNVTQNVDTFKSVPTNCEIIVKDDTQKAWMNTNFPTMTNVKTVAEYEAEQSE